MHPKQSQLQSTVMRNESFTGDCVGRCGRRFASPLHKSSQQFLLTILILFSSSLSPTDTSAHRLWVSRSLLHTLPSDCPHPPPILPLVIGRPFGPLSASPIHIFTSRPRSMGIYSLENSMAFQINYFIVIVNIFLIAKAPKR